jgi:microcystin-dependent protein
VARAAFSHFTFTFNPFLQMRIMATQAGIVPVTNPLLPETAERRSLLKRLGALLGLSVLAGPALAAPRGARSTAGIDPYIGEIMMFAGNFVINGWAQCNGQLISIQQNTALFSILGTQYGGNGTTTFGLPNLQGRMPIGFGNGAGLSPHVIGEVGGTENVTLLSTQMPQHLHTNALSMANAAATTNVPTGNVLAKPNFTDNDGNLFPVNAYAAAPASGAVAGAVTNTGTAGGNQPHSNMQPYLALNFLIATQGIFPSRI